MSNSDVYFIPWDIDISFAPQDERESLTKLFVGQLNRLAKIKYLKVMLSVAMSVRVHKLDFIRGNNFKSCVYIHVNTCDVATCFGFNGKMLSDVDGIWVATCDNGCKILTRKLLNSPVTAPKRLITIEFVTA